MIKTCPTCGKEFKPLRSTAKFCSDKCRQHAFQATRNRITIPQDLRFTILRRDGFKCRYCGATPDQKHLHVDHLISVKDGGPLTASSNLVTACPDCNLGKGARSVDPAELS